jgi:DNA modification methylase
MPIIHGDCIEQMKFLPDCSIDSIVTDPPYELGFMNKGWDSSGIAYNVNVWRECFRLLKPGGHLLSFGGTRTYHRMAVAIEDAGFEIRDQINWVYGSGFPKSLDISKAIDKAGGTEKVVGKGRAGKTALGQSSEWNKTNNPHEFNITEPNSPDAIKWNGYGTALKPAHEPIVVARKPIEGTVANNVLKHGCGGLNIDGCRVGTDDGLGRPYGGDNKIYGKFNMENGTRTGDDLQGRFPANLIHDGSEEVVREFPQTTSGGGQKNKGDNRCIFNTGKTKLNSLDGNWESSKGFAARFFKSCPIDEADYACLFYCAKASKKERNMGCEGLEEKDIKGAVGMPVIDNGRSVEYESHGKKYERKTRGKNTHPTVKPLSLMRYLVRLVTPPDGTVLDPFVGSGTTIMAAVQECFNGIGIEQDADSVAIAKCRVAAVQKAEEQLSIV